MYFFDEVIFPFAQRILNDREGYLLPMIVWSGMVRANGMNNDIRPENYSDGGQSAYHDFDILLTHDILFFHDLVYPYHSSLVGLNIDLRIRLDAVFHRRYGFQVVEKSDYPVSVWGLL